MTTISGNGIEKVATFERILQHPGVEDGKEKSMGRVLHGIGASVDPLPHPFELQKIQAFWRKPRHNTNPARMSSPAEVSGDGGI